MRYFRRFISIIILVMHAGSLIGQGQARESLIKIVTPELQKKYYTIDSEAGAIVLFENRCDRIDQNINKYYVTSLSQRFIKILKPNFVDLANENLIVHVKDPTAIVNSITAFSCNLAGSTVSIDTVKKQDILVKQLAENIFKISYSIPNVKEGSVIFSSYTMPSLMGDRLPTWKVQESIPKLHTEYWLIYPPKMNLISEAHMRPKMHEAKDRDAFENSPEEYGHITGYGNYPRYYSSSLWLRKNVPAAKPEPLVNNYTAGIERFDILIKAKPTSHGMEEVASTWQTVNSDLINDKDFGKQIYAKNKFLKNVVDSININNQSIPERTKAVYGYVRSNIAMDTNKRFSLKTDLSDVFEQKKGSVTDKNMMLIAMLRQCSVDAYPILLSTTDRPALNPDIGDTDDVNYVACAVKQGDDYLFLDAYNKNSYFGELPVFCYNGYSRIIADEGIGITITTRMLKDNSVTSIKIDSINDSSARIEIFNKPGKLFSYMLRDRLSQDEKLKDRLIENMVNDLDPAITITTSNIANLDNPDTSVVLYCSGRYNFQRSDTEIFFNTAGIKVFKQNPFISVKRILPIDFPEQHRYVGNLFIAVPEKYTITNAPKPLSLSYDNDRISYERIVNVGADKNLIIRSVYAINDTRFMPSEYDELRNFFKDMVNSDSDILILKKVR